MGKSLPADLDWLLHGDEGERSVPVGERVEIADERWSATTERLAVGDGMRVFLTSADVRRGVTLEPRHAEAEPWLVSNIAVEGKVALALSDGYSADITTDRSVMYRPVDLRARYTPEPGQKLRLAGYMLSGVRVRLMLGDELPAMIVPLIEHNSGRSELFEIPAAAGLRQLARSLFTSRLRGALRLLFIEGVVLQLLATQTSGRARSRSVPKPLSARDRDTLAEAHSRLLADMRHPPSLAELAAAVKMDEKALNAGFRTVYGGTVFETLRNERLEQARAALAREAVSMKHVAFRVGYDHVTNFISAFTARFGAPPRQYTDERARIAGEASR